MLAFMACDMLIFSIYCFGYIGYKISEKPGLLQGNKEGNMISQKIVVRASMVMALLLMLVAPVHADYTMLTLPTPNFNLSNLTSGSNYEPLFPSTQTWNSVPFSLVTSGGNEAFYATPGQPQFIDVIVNKYGVTNAYTIINSAWGSFGSVIGTVQFVGSGTASLTVNLTEGINVRDHYNGSYNNTINDVDAKLAWAGAGGIRLDMQYYNLPSDFWDENLVYIRFSSFALGSPSGSPILVAATVYAPAQNQVPEPLSMLLLGVGLAGLAGVRRFK